MGVVQVSVQSAAGQLRLGEAAASVQFSRSIGAAFGTAMVATMLFAVLTLKNPEAARVFASMVEQGGNLPPHYHPLSKPLSNSISRKPLAPLFVDGGVHNRRIFLRAH